MLLLYAYTVWNYFWITSTAVTAQLSDTLLRLCFIINAKMHEGYFVALLITLTFFLHSWPLAPSLMKKQSGNQPSLCNICIRNSRYACNKDSSLNIPEFECDMTWYCSSVVHKSSNCHLKGKREDHKS